MTEREEYGKLADEMDDQADRLAEHSASLGEEITDTRNDWERKRADAKVPGATPDWDDPDEDEDEDDYGEDDDKDDKDNEEDEDED